MLQAIGLTSCPRRDLPPAVDDLTFDAHPGQVTALLGPAGSGKTTALRLMLELEPGRGVTSFRGRPLHRVAHPASEVGVLLGDVAGHPSRTLRSQLRMLCAAAGVPVSQADEMLRVVGLTGLHDQRIGTLPLGMDRRLGLACALLGDPHTLLLDEPGAGLSVRESAWLYELLRAHAEDGGTVLFTTEDPRTAARHADHVVTLDAGRLVADQDVADFARTRLRPRVAVRTPHAARLAAVVTQEARAAKRPVEVVTENGNRLSVYGSDCATIGEAAFRHGVLIHQLADEVGDTGPALPAARDHTGSGGDRVGRTVRSGDPADPEDPDLDPEDPRAPGALARPETPGHPGPRELDVLVARRIGAGPEPELFDAAHPSTAAAGPESEWEPGPASASASESCAAPGTRPLFPPDLWFEAEAEPEPTPADSDLAGPTSEGSDLEGPAPETRATVTPVASARRRPPRAPLRPLRYEVRRLLGVPPTWLVLAATVGASVLISVLLARGGRTPLPAALAGWPALSPLPPAALGAGLLGAFSFGDEYRYPALTTGRGTVPRRLGLLLAKLAVAAGVAVVLAVVVVVADLEALRLVYGGDLIPLPDNWATLCASWLGLLIGCAWAGVLGAGVFRAAAAGVAAVLAVPIVLVPLLGRLVSGPSVRPVAGLPARLREFASLEWPAAVDHWLEGALRVVVQPVGVALTFALTALLCAYLFTGLSRKARW
ncbi:ATP-binding cassette domain-containing protein [Streptomyces sp. NPDC048338]|uniref:ATP-binding cassette domain-containing protein n=1 Tax=Streptomyces sp. NPDC048338 TaxID=3365536 RepID=UPI003713191A